MRNAVLLLAEAILYFSLMAVLFRMRRRFGLGIFVCALGSMHFLETYLAAILYLELAPGFVFSPGSVVLFSGKLILLLLVYVYEDAEAVRQPIYGLFFGNVLVLALILLLRLHDATPAMSGGGPNFAFMNQMGGLMVWGTLLLLADSLFIIMLFERLKGTLGRTLVLRVWLSAATVLTFDQIGFYLALRIYADAPLSVLFGGWLAKLLAAGLYSLLIGAYVRFVERGDAAARGSLPLSDTFDVLTYREKYEDLLDRSGRDGLTGVEGRGRLETDGPGFVDAAIRSGRPMSAILIDLDDFKRVNDRSGHLAGDDVLRHVAKGIAAQVRASDRVFRYGGDEFLVLCDGLPHPSALRLAERLRGSLDGETLPAPVTMSIGVATGPEQGASLRDLIAGADAALYAAKNQGRDAVRGAV